MEQQAAISDEHTRAKPTHPKAASSNDIHAAAIEAIKQAYQGRYATPIAYALGVKKSTVRAWFSNCNPPRRMPLAREKQLLEHLSLTIARLQAVKEFYAVHFEERKRRPPRKQGMLVVQDHGDGLPPHNQQAHVLKRLGLRPGQKESAP